MARVLKGSHSFTCTPTRSSEIGMNHIPAFAFPAIAGTRLPTPERWKAELTWVVGFVVRQFSRFFTVFHGFHPARVRKSLVLKTSVSAAD